MSEKILQHRNYQQDGLFAEENHSAASGKASTGISRKNWEMSYRKWKLLVILARLRIRFHTKRGFSFLNVIGKCGYCIEFKSNCFNCNLYKQSLCCSINNLTKEKREKTVLWKYLNVMQKSVKNYNIKIDWQKDVLAYAIGMRDAIKKDKPKRRINHSSLFYKSSFRKLFNPIL
ncbi:hypothetical protein [Candidatus Scalindua japonica]|uniref:hypothetical protein n=1 Tax=Candidatus Scalindua japonica TaxID=1284222 RepID=UPI000BDF558E|nr:hypothetical protein [Candidatus Scalindua japonica]